MVLVKPINRRQLEIHKTKVIECNELFKTIEEKSKQIYQFVNIFTNFANKTPSNDIVHP